MSIARGSPARRSPSVLVQTGAATAAARRRCCAARRARSRVPWPIAAWSPRDGGHGLVLPQRRVGLSRARRRPAPGHDGAAPRSRCRLPREGCCAGPVRRRRAAVGHRQPAGRVAHPCRVGPPEDVARHRPGPARLRPAQRPGRAQPDAHRCRCGRARQPRCRSHRQRRGTGGVRRQRQWRCAGATASPATGASRSCSWRRIWTPPMPATGSTPARW